MDLSNDVVQASAVTYLLEGQEVEAVRILLACRLELVLVDRITDDFEGVHADVLHANLTCSRATMDIINDKNNPISSQIKGALDATVPSNYWIKSLWGHFEVQELDADWRERLSNIADGKEMNNQGTAHGNVPIAPIPWMGLRFRSQSEVRIAKALEAVGVLFFPRLPLSH